MSVFITGATGFVGINLVHSLVETHDVTVLIRESSPVDRLPTDITKIEGDLLNPNTYRDAVAKSDTVIHLAAILPGEDNYSIYQDINVEGTEKLLETAEEEGVKSFIFLSTAAAHPDTSEKISNFYIKSKKEASERIRNGEWTLTTKILYPTHIFGPDDYRLVRYNKFRKVESNPILFPPFFAPGTQNIVHVQDVIESITILMDDSNSGYYLISGENVRIYQLYREIAKSGESRCFVLPIPQLITNHVLIRSLRILHRNGFLPEVPDQSSQDGIVPDEYQNSGPGTRRSIRETIQDSYNWYKEMDLLDS